MAEVFELRIHGVGGTPPEGLLGEPIPSDFVRTGGDGKSAFFARLRDHRRVEGYAWGPLTSSGLVQPLWIFLLPFTLLNVAGWMLPPRSEAKWRLWAPARLLIVLLGLSLTLAYVFGMSVLVIRQLSYEWRLGTSLDGRTALILGTVVLAIIGAVVFWVARRKQREFEGFTGPLDGPLPEGPKAALSQARNRLVPKGDEGFADRGFWASGGAALSNLWLHAIVGTLGLGLLVSMAWEPVSAGRVINWRMPFLVLGRTQAGLLFLLLVVCFAGFPWRRFLSRHHFRWVGPVVTITTAIGLTAGLFNGSALLLAKVPPPQTWVSRELELDLNLAFALAALSAALMALLVVLHLLARSTREGRRILDARKGEPPRSILSSVGPGMEPDGIPPPLVMKLARARALSQFGRNADLILTVPAIAFALVTLLPQRWVDISATRRIDLWAVAAVVFAATLIAFVSGRPNLSKRTGMPLAAVLVVFWIAVAAALIRFEPKITVGALGEFGAAAVLGGTAAFLGLWIRGYFKPEQRRLIAIVWDVLTFFPRRFHPLAVRPYSERAVQEIIGRLYYHLDVPKPWPEEGRRVILSAHSQGTVLAYAALMQLKGADSNNKRKRLSRIALVTYGSPLSQLHAAFFPAYFSKDLFDELETRLFLGNVTRDSATVPASWRNFYRLTDYIGKQVAVGDPRERHNEQVPDPPEKPQMSESPLDQMLEGRPDPFRSPWVALSLHSHYNADPALKTWLHDLREEMG